MQKFERFFRNCGGVLQNQNKSHKVCIAHSNFQFRKFHLDIYLVIMQPKMSKNYKKSYVLCKNLPKLNKKFEKFYLDIHLVIIQLKMPKQVKNHYKYHIFWENPPKLQKNLGNLTIISVKF